MEREKGVALMPCGNCGEQVPAVTQPDGSQVAGECPNCNQPKEKAEKRVAREKATEVQEDEQ